ncbi:MAG: HPr kinase/phosphorylase [Pseudomonadota bacterium]|nr:HPr kinase/phosphorylase [Pseudomonadota bacterium]
MQTIHGVALSIYGCGIIICGSSGIGKSELALELVSHGHQFIADDVVNVSRADAENHVTIINPDKQFFINIRGLGFIDIQQIFNKQNSIKNSSKLDMIIQLSNMDLLTIDPLEQLRDTTEILGTQISRYTLIKGVSRPLAVLVEVLVKQYLEQNSTSFDSHEAFIEMHRKH